MKRPILLMSMVALLVVSDGNPFADLGAAEVWNSQSKRQITSDKRTIFNRSKNSSVGKGPTTLYNRQSRSDINASSHGGLNSRIQSYKSVDLTKQVPSKLWGLLSPQALENRQADIDHALKNEYERKKATSKVIIAAMREYEKHRVKVEREYERNLERMKQDPEGYQERQNEKRIQALREARPDDQDSNQSTDISSRAPVSENTQVLKRSVRLFNSTK